MTMSDVCHHTHIRSGNPAESVHFSEIADPHFQNGNLMLLSDGKHGKRKADLVIKIPLGLVHAVFF